MSDPSVRDDASRCVFMFADSRRYTLPQYRNGTGLYYYHAQQLVNDKRLLSTANEVNRLLNSKISTACDLGYVFKQLFSAIFQGLIEPKTASTLAYLSQLVLQTHMFPSGVLKLLKTKRFIQL
jgi:hypothetical protein